MGGKEGRRNGGLIERGLYDRQLGIEQLEQGPPPFAPRFARSHGGKPPLSKMDAKGDRIHVPPHLHPDLIGTHFMRTVCILRSLRHPEQRHLGLTGGLDLRRTKHDSGGSPHTSKFLPWESETAVGFKDRDKAAACEKYRKTGSGFAFAKKLFGTLRAFRTSGGKSPFKRLSIQCGSAANPRVYGRIASDPPMCRIGGRARGGLRAGAGLRRASRWAGAGAARRAAAAAGAARSCRRRARRPRSAWPDCRRCRIRSRPPRRTLR